MNILLIHNFYRQPGGEDQVFRAEAALLEAYGHTVIRFQEHNDSVKELSSIELAADTIWNRWTFKQLRTLIREGRVDLMHVHNSFPLISPACYYAAGAEAIPVVQTLHNYRVLCPSATLFRDGAVCEDCLGKRIPWPSVVHSCYRGSRSATAAAAVMLATHRALGTWQRRVSTFIALTEFARSKFIEGGLPQEKIVVKPNFLPEDPGCGSGDGGFVLFVGRLVEEKGIRTLLRAWSISKDLPPLEIIGDGPLAADVAAAVSENANIRWRGWLARDRVFERMKSATAIVLPSEWYEAFPMTVVESFAMGVPVLASNLGSLASLIEHQKTGLHFAAGDAEDLSRQVQWLQSHPNQVLAIRLAARRAYLLKYTGEQNYLELRSIYDPLLKGMKGPDVEIAAGAAVPQARTLRES
jgi:glycosyltransferase involved in cell wall biosynthesis